MHSTIEIAPNLEYGMTRHIEEEYFVREDAEKKHKIEVKKKKAQKEQAKAHQKKLHYMRCSKCGDGLKTIKIGLIDVDQCADCGCIVIEKGDLKKIILEESSIFHGFIELFQKD